MDDSALRLLSFIGAFLIDCANAISSLDTSISDIESLIRLDRWGLVTHIFDEIYSI